MPSLPAYLINPVIVETDQGPLSLKAGAKIADSTTLAAVQAVGCQVFPTDDPVLSAAVALVPNYVAKGRNEEELGRMVWSAAIASAGATQKFTLYPAIATTSAAYPLQPAPAGHAGTLFGATIAFLVQPASGESIVVQVQKNGSNISGATVTYSHSGANSTPFVSITIPNIKGVTYIATDYFDVNVTYTAGSTPAMTGKFSYANMVMIGQ